MKIKELNEIIDKNRVKNKNEIYEIDFLKDFIDEVYARLYNKNELFEIEQYIAEKIKGED